MGKKAKLGILGAEERQDPGRMWDGFQMVGRIHHVICFLGTEQ